MTTKIPAELSSTPGIADSSNATAITIDSSENITVVGSFTIDTGTNGVPTINLSHSNANADNFRIQSGIAGVGNSGMSIRDVDASANRLTIDTSGNVSVVGGNLVIGTSGKGIDFSSTGDGSGTMSGELFDDYEEGTWTPSLPNGGTVNTIYYATYTKIGRQVTAYVYMNFTATNNSSIFFIGGLPYTGLNDDGHYGGGSLSYGGTFNFSAFSDPLVLYNTDDIYYHQNSGTNQQVKNSAFGGSAIEWITQIIYATD